jgi:hypothetical protein
MWGGIKIKIISQYLWAYNDVMCDADFQASETRSNTLNIEV